MSLYGDLPPPTTSTAADSPSKKTEGDAKEGTAASGAAKSVLPAGWSSSITRLKPMLNRKLPPPKTRPAQRTIPAGFVAQPVQEPHKDAATLNPGVTAVPSSTSGNNVTSQSAGAQHSSGNTLDETSWLKARTAQVQRNDNDVHSVGRKQMKRTPVKAQQQQGPISLDDEYDISRPNDPDTLAHLHAHALTHDPGLDHARVHGHLDRDRDRDLAQDKSLGPQSQGRAHAEGTVVACLEAHHHGNMDWGEQRPLAYKAFAPPSNQTTQSHVAGQNLQRKPEIASPPSQNRGATILNDTSGEDAFLRRAQLTQQRLSEASTPSMPSVPTNPPPQGHQQYQLHNRPAFTPNVSEQAARSPSPVILLTNMVGPGEVDDTLQEETAMECEKFGSVVRCLIFEVQNGKVPPEEAVRIFVKFGSLVSAERALKDLDGRFFGGRQVRGQFFDEKRFDSLQLAP
ncbi:hypothetical protein BGZ68_001058 [Mortierella alpina]|nr:hypothetical protein BGZ68_001058 [Mortierella alpina]